MLRFHGRRIFRKSVSSLGNDVIYVEKWPWFLKTDRSTNGGNTLTDRFQSMQDYQQLKKRIESAQAVAFFAMTQSNVEYLNTSIDNITLWGATEEYEETRDFEITMGRFLTPFEINSGKNYAVIGTSIVEELFGNIDPVGKTIKVKGKYLTIIGIFGKEGKSFLGGGSLDKVILIPVRFLATIVDLRTDESNPSIWIRVQEGIPIEQFKEEVRGTMRAIRRLKPGAKDNFALNQSSALNAQIASIFGIINFAGGFIGILSVIVGAFGIANIMFVSVKERTNIIGIQKALGAKKYYIILEVLYESVLLSIVGGILALILVFGGTIFIRNSFDFNIYMSIGNILTGIIISTLAGRYFRSIPRFHGRKARPG